MIYRDGEYKGVGLGLRMMKLVIGYVQFKVYGRYLIGGGVDFWV